MTRTLTQPPAYIHSTGRSIMLSESKWIEEHHRMIESEAFQRAIMYAKDHYTRACCSSPPPGTEKSDVTVSHALAMARLQGAQDFVSVLLGLAELPTEKPAAKNLDNLE